jgi:MraZ protein
MLGFVGRFEHTLDAKGRLILPSRFRPDFEGGGNLTQHFEGCLALWTPGEFSRQLHEMLELSRLGDPDARNRARVWSSGASVVDVDRQGRFAIPASARSFADLEGDVLVIGSIDHIEVWNPRRFEDRVIPAEEYFSGSGLAK